MAIRVVVVFEEFRRCEDEHYRTIHREIAPPEIDTTLQLHTLLLIRTALLIVYCIHRMNI